MRRALGEMRQEKTRAAFRRRTARASGGWVRSGIVPSLDTRSIDRHFKRCKYHHLRCGKNYSKRMGILLRRERMRMGEESWCRACGCVGAAELVHRPIHVGMPIDAAADRGALEASCPGCTVSYNHFEACHGFAPMMVGARGWFINASALRIDACSEAAGG